MKPGKISVSVTLDEDLLQKLRKLADADSRSLSQYINVILREHLNSANNSQPQWIEISGVDIMRPLKEKVSISLDKDMVEQLKELAEKNNRLFSQYINFVLRDYITNKLDKK